MNKKQSKLLVVFFSERMESVELINNSNLFIPSVIKFSHDSASAGAGQKASEWRMSV